jgi:hypothetical protein
MQGKEGRGEKKIGEDRREEERRGEDKRGYNWRLVYSNVMLQREREKWRFEAEIYYVLMYNSLGS